VRIIEVPLTFDFNALGFWPNVGIFIVSASVIWLMGSRLAIYADVIADRTGLGQALIGIVLLAVVTSLPEIARTITAGIEQRPEVIIDSLFGGMILLLAVLAVADGIVAGKRTVTYFAPEPVLLLQGAVLILLLGIALAGATTGEFLSVFGVGLWVTIILIVYLASLVEMRSYDARKPWRPAQIPTQESHKSTVADTKRQRPSLRRTFALVAVISVLVFVMGIVITESGIALAQQSGLGTGFVGATLLAFAAALPETSVTFSAVRIGAYSMAISNIFGTNALLVALLFLGDVFYPAPLLDTVSNAAIFAIAANIVTTVIYVMGMLERRNRTVLGMGLDSLSVLVTYGITLVVLYQLS
jgi:cation:H+ antiporter